MDEYIKKSDAIEAINELDISMSMCLSTEECKGMRFGRQISLEAVKRVEPVTSLDAQVYGFRLKDIIVFAHACRMAGVQNHELKDFVNATVWMCEVFSKKVDEETSKQLKRFFEGSVIDDA